MLQGRCKCSLGMGTPIVVLCVCADLLKALVGVDVVQPGQLVVVKHQRGRVQDQLRRGAVQLLQTLTTQ